MRKVACLFLFAVFWSHFLVAQDSLFETVIYPNPSTEGAVKILLPHLNSGIAEIEVYDFTGRKVLSDSFDTAIKQQHNLDVTRFIPGNYFIMIRTEFGSNTSKISIN